MNNLAPELNCMILSNITEVSHIIDYMKVSKEFLNAARYCIKTLTSDEIVEVPISNFFNFRILQKIDRYILLTAVNNFQILSTIPNLKSATFYLGNIENLEVLKRDILNLILNINFNGGNDIRIICNYNDSPIGFILQNDKFMIYGPTEPFNFDNLFIQIQKIYRHLIFVPSTYVMTSDKRINYIDTFKCFPEPLFMKKRLVEFLSNTDFGLLYPNQPPSPNNPAVSNYAKIIGNFGIDNYADDDNICRILLEVYLVYNQIIDFNNIDQHLQPYEDEYNQILNSYMIEEPLNFEDDFWTIIRNTMFFDEPSFQDILDFDVPNLSGYNDNFDYCNILPDMIRDTLGIYGELFDNNEKFYTSKGELRSMKYYKRFTVW
jgi:hypothetical protein